MKSREGKNIFSVDTGTEASRKHGVLQAADFQKMADAVSGGRAVILSSYTPHYEGYGDRELPSEPGLGAVITANLSDRVVLPMAINWQGRGRFGLATEPKEQIKSYIQNRGRPRADLNIAEPIFLDSGIPEEFRTTKADVEQALLIVDAKNRHSLPPGERKRALETWAKLRKQAELVMLAQASVSQRESQGDWADKLYDREMVEHVDPALGEPSPALVH